MDLPRPAVHGAGQALSSLRPWGSMAVMPLAGSAWGWAGPLQPQTLGALWL